MSGFFLNKAVTILTQRGLSPGGAAQRYVDSQVLFLSRPYIPRQSGRLIASGSCATKIGSGTVVWNTPYARYVYYGKSQSGKDLIYRGGGLRGSFWFERMKISSLPQILKGAALLSGGKVKT